MKKRFLYLWNISRRLLLVHLSQIPAYISTSTLSEPIAKCRPNFYDVSKLLCLKAKPGLYWMPPASISTIKTYSCIRGPPFKTLCLFNCLNRHTHTNSLLVSTVDSRRLRVPVGQRKFAYSQSCRSCECFWRVVWKEYESFELVRCYFRI